MSSPSTGVGADAESRRVLNVGGNSKAISIPAYYTGWQHHLLDIDASVNPDVLCDARDMTRLAGTAYDAVYCSHNLEHYYRHDVPKVLRGFHHVLKEDGFADIRVPDLAAVMSRVVAQGMDIEDVLYQSAAGPITVRDVIYGWGVEIERSGCDFFAHKTGFTQKSLHNALLAVFPWVYTGRNEPAFELRALAFKNPPSPAYRELFRLPTA
ncbi:MAG TPA: methyltransferase domain-containing protein [Burkholderiales bacterium]